MTDDELAPLDYRSPGASFIVFIDQLANEVAALRAQMAQMRPVMEAIVAHPPFIHEHCAFCFAWRALSEVHKPDCPVTLARQILAPQSDT